MRSVAGPRQGLTLVEVLIAVLFVSVVLLALEGSAAVLMRRLADGAREALAARLVQSRTDRIAGTLCAASGGVDSVNGVVATWFAVPDTGFVTLTQTTRYLAAAGVRSESYRAVVPCR